MLHLRYLLLFFCVCGSMANARGYGPAVAKNSTGFDIKFASNGTPLANMSNTATGVAVGSAVALPLSSSVIIQAAATGAITGASAAGAWGAAFGALGGLALLAYPEIVSYLGKSKIRMTSTGGLEKMNEGGCSVAPCYEFSALGSASVRTKAELIPLVRAIMAQQDATITFCSFTYRLEPTGSTHGQGAITRSCNSDPPNDRYPISLVSVPPWGEASFSPVTVAAAVLDLNAQSPTAAEVQALIDLNFPPEVTLPNVTGAPRAYLGNTVQMFSPSEKRTIESWAKMDYSVPGKVGVSVETVTKFETAAQSTTAVTVNADGTTSTTTTLTPAQSTSTTVNSNGLTKTTVVTSPDGSTVTVASPTTKADEPSETCGLPGTPACKIDETGTKADAGATFDEPKTKIDEAKTAAETAIAAAGNIAAPAWSFTFQLPTGCAPYVTGIKGVVLNVCQYQSTIHGLLSVIWAAATAFAMIGMVGRTIREA